MLATPPYLLGLADWRTVAKDTKSIHSRREGGNVRDFFQSRSGLATYSEPSSIERGGVATKWITISSFKVFF